MTADHVRSRARLCKHLVTIPLALLLALAAALVGNAVVQKGGDFLPFVIIYYAPMALYVAAAILIRSALGRIAAGDLFADVLPSLVSKGGGLLLAGALLTEVGVPLLTWLVTGSAFVRTFEPSAVTLGIVGAMLILFGQLFGRALADRRELEQFI